MPGLTHNLFSIINDLIGPAQPFVLQMNFRTVLSLSEKPSGRFVVVKFETQQMLLCSFWNLLPKYKSSTYQLAAACLYTHKISQGTRFLSLTSTTKGSSQTRFLHGLGKNHCHFNSTLCGFPHPHPCQTGQGMGHINLPCAR